jgi:hypothetical protein
MMRWGEMLVMISKISNDIYDLIRTCVLSQPTGKTLAKESKANIEYNAVDVAGLKVALTSNSIDQLLS